MISKLFSPRGVKSQSKRRSHSKRVVNFAIYAGLLIVLAVLVSTGYKTSGANVQVATNANQIAADTAQSANLPVATASDVQSANLAAAVAQATSLSAADSVSNKSVSMNASAALDQPDVTTVSKPQIADPTATPEPIISYTVQEGDTAATVASKFDVSDQTVRWANNLTTDAVAAGATLTVPVLDGVVYTVKDGDNLADVAAKYRSGIDNIITVNNLTGPDAAVGAKLLLPDGVLPANEQPGYQAPTVSRPSNGASNSVQVLYAATATGNRYAYGYCTWYAYNRRMALGLPIGGNWGNAATWAAYARGAGYLVDHTPAVGAVMQTAGGWGGYGHVAVVESVNADGTIVISEMNGVAGWNRVGTRTVPNPEAYNFIH